MREEEELRSAFSPSVTEFAPRVRAGCSLFRGIHEVKRMVLFDDWRHGRVQNQTFDGSSDFRVQGEVSVGLDDVVEDLLGVQLSSCGEG